MTVLGVLSYNNMNIKNNVIIKAVTFRGNKIYLPTVLLFWYFIFSLIILFIPQLLFIRYALAENILLPFILFDFFSTRVLLAEPLLEEILFNIGLVRTESGFFTSFIVPTLLGYIIIFSIILFIFYLVNYILGKLLIHIFKFKK